MERWEQTWSDHIMSKNPDPFIPRLISISYNSVPPHTNIHYAVTYTARQDILPLILWKQLWFFCKTTEYTFILLICKFCEMLLF